MAKRVTCGSSSGAGIGSGNAEVDQAVAGLIAEGGTRAYFGSTFAAWQVIVRDREQYGSGRKLAR